MAKEKPTPNQQLRYERIRRGWSQQDLADEIGTTPLNIGRWERGVTRPGPHFRRKLYAIFEKTAQELGLLQETTDTHTTTEVPLQTPTIALSRDTPVSLWNVPYNRNLLFTGREDLLTQLHDAFMQGQLSIALAQPQAISELGGIGKTQTAVEYAYRYHGSYDSILWARADSTDMLISDFLLIAALLNLPQRNEQDQSMVVKAVVHWFDTHERWLLILDNADQLEPIKEFIPSAGKGHVLLTTRANSTGTIAERIELDTMGLDEGTLFLLRRAKLLKGNFELDYNTQIHFAHRERRDNRHSPQDVLRGVLARTVPVPTLARIFDESSSLHPTTAGKFSPVRVRRSRFDDHGADRSNVSSPSRTVYAD